MSKVLFRDHEPYPIEVASTEGSYLVDKSGKKYLDFLGGWCVGNIGWGKKEIRKSIANFHGPTYVSPTYNYQRWEDLAEKLVSLTGGNRTCFRATGGTEAVEIALKIARAYNKRKKFIAFNNAYHGQSFAAMALVNLHPTIFGPYPDNYIRLDTNWEEATERAVKEIKTEKICAYISEPIICNLAVMEPPVSFFKAVREACAETNTVFIMDEVATGFGRTGKWFGYQNFDLDPDVVTMAKGMVSGYSVIGATVAKSEIAEPMKFSFSNYSTFGWQPLAVEASLAVVNYMEKNKLIEKSVETAAYLRGKLSKFSKPEGKGMCIGFEVKDEGIKQKCMEDSLLIDAFDNRVVMFPPLDVSREDVDKAIEIIERNL